MFAAQQTVRQFVTHCRSKQIVAVLLLIHACLLSWNAIRLAPVATEMAHLVAGLSHLELNRYDLMAVNPPLVRTVAVLPLPLFFRPKYDWSSYDPEPLSRSEHFVGRDFVLINGSQAFVFLSVARLLCIPFSLLGLLICYAWAAELYGRVSGILSASLWCFSPIILGHGSLILPDVSAAALGVTATYIFRWTLFAPSIGKTIASGFVLGLAVLAKMTLLVLYPVFAVFWILWPRSVPGRFWFRLRHACLQVLVSVLVINMGYAFTDTLLPLRTFQFHSITLSGITSWKEARNLGENRFKNTWLGSLPCPLPASFVKGLDKQKSDFESPQPSFLFGEWKQGGWPWYYCAGLLLKLPAGTWVLLGIAIYLSIARRKYNASFADEMLVLLPMLSILLLVSSQTAFNHHLRYVIPCLPFLYVWIGKVARLTSFWGILIVAALAVWNVVSSLAFYPHSYSYFNELCGGPRAGPQYFS